MSQNNLRGEFQTAQRNKNCRATQRALAWVPAALVLWGAATDGQAQTQGTPPPAPTLQLQALSPTVYWGREGGSNVGVVIGDRGVIVIDTTSSRVRGEHLIGEIAKITSKPVNAIILTHLDGDHVGGVSAFPVGVQIIAQTETARALKEDALAGRGRVPVDHLPNREVVSQETTTLDGVKVKLMYWAPAHTSGDLVVYLPDQKVVFTGDIFALDLPRPFVKPEFNGTVEGWIKSARGILALDSKQIVVGHGEVQTKETLKPFVETAVKERDQIKTLIAKGQSLEQIEIAVRDSITIYPAKLPPIFEPYSHVVYKELTAKK